MATHRVIIVADLVGNPKSESLEDVADLVGTLTSPSGRFKLGDVTVYATTSDLLADVAQKKERVACTLPSLVKLPTRPPLRRLTCGDVSARMRDKRFQITTHTSKVHKAKAPCIICEKKIQHLDAGGIGYTCSGMAGGVEHLYLYCQAGCDPKLGVDVHLAAPDHLGGDGLFVVWRCPCRSLTARQGWKPSMGDDCPDYGSAYDVVGDECHVCHRLRMDPKRPKAGKGD